MSHDGASPTELTLATLSPLETGRVGLNYNYIPAGGWADGNYDFKLQLNLDSKPYASSLEKQFKVGGSGAAEGVTSPSTPPPATEGMSPYVIGGIIAAVVVVAIIALLLVRMLRRD